MIIKLPNWLDEKLGGTFCTIEGLRHRKAWGVYFVRYPRAISFYVFGSELYFQWGMRR